MKNVKELLAIVLLMAVFMLFILSAFIGIIIFMDPCGTGSHNQQAYEDVQEQIRDEIMIQGGLISR